MCKMNYFRRVIPNMKHYSDIVSDLPPGSLYAITILTFYLAFFLGYTLTFYLTFYLASILTYFLANILTFFLASILTFYLASFQAFMLAFFLASLLTFSLTFCLAFYLTFSGVWLTYSMPEIWRSRLRSGAHWDLGSAHWPFTASPLTEPFGAI